MSLFLHGSEPQQQSLHRHRVSLHPSATGYQAADRPLAFPSCGKADIMEESSAEAPDSSTQDDVPPLGETHRHNDLEVREVSPQIGWQPWVGKETLQSFSNS